MGNECDQCQAVTQGCKRQQFRTQLKNRQKLDISRAQANQKSKSKLQSLMQLRNQINVDNNYPKDPDSARDQQMEESLEIVKKQIPPQDKTQNNKKSKQVKKQPKEATPTFKQSLNLKGSLKQKKSQLDAMFEGTKTSPLKEQTSNDNDDFNFIKLPLQSGIEGSNMKKLEQLERALMMSRQPPKFGKLKQSNKKIRQSHLIKDNNSTVYIAHPLEESIEQKQDDKENSFMKKDSMRNEPNFNKFSNKKEIPDIQKPVVIKKTISIDRSSSPISKYPQGSIPHHSVLLQSQNPSNVLRQFNNSLQQSPIHPLKHQPKSPIEYEQSEIPYDDESIAVQEYAFQVRSGIYFQGYISTQNRKIQNEANFKFQADKTQMIAYFKNGSLNTRKNVLLGFQDGCMFDGTIKKATQKSQFMACGEGKFIMPDQSYYHGEWLKNLPHGKGLHKFSDGSYYEGQFIQGRKQGQGKFTSDTGDIIYHGSFLNNRIEGLGVMYIIQPNTGKKRIYRGYFKNGKLQGDKCQAEYVEQKARYIGSFKDGKKCGNGTYYYGDGRSWEGHWQDNRQNGYGKLKNQKGVQTDGYWIDGIKSEGKMTKK